jgi:N-acetyl-alpha-D-muramate 1-phosphate uridylyltransferase
MADSLPASVAGVVLAAGAGERLRPLTRVRPKALCPVGNVPLVDLAIERVEHAVGCGPDRVAVNVHHGRAQLEPHLRRAGTVHVSIEEARALGTAGAIGHLREWLAGRPALVVNADAWCTPDLARFVAGWDGERVRIMVPGHAPFGPRSGIVASLLPWSDIQTLEPVPSGLYECCWGAAAAAGRVETVAYDGPFVDCGTPAQYLAANLAAADAAPPASASHRGSIVAADAIVAPGAIIGRSVIGGAARIVGTVRNSVVWPGARVEAGERLDHTIRTAGGITVIVR